MDILILCLTSACFAFASGIFLSLSYIEKPIWALMRTPTTTSVPDVAAREVHTILGNVIHLLPPTMKTAMGLGSALLLLQTWRTGWAALPLTTIVVLAGFMAYILPRLGPRISAVMDQDPEGDIRAVRHGVGKLAALHHAGLAMSTTVLLLELLTAFSG